MKKRKRMLLGLALLLGIVAIVGCGDSSAGQEAGENDAKTTTVLRIGHVEAEDRSTHRALLLFQ